MGKILGIIIVIVLVAVGWFFFGSKQSSAPTGDGAKMTKENTSEPTIGGTAGKVGATKEFVIESANFSFAPNTMTVKKGDLVKITLKNKEGLHDLKIDELGVATSRLNGVGEEKVEFVADKTGTFEYYCSVGEHRAMGMKGTLKVE